MNKKWIFMAKSCFPLFPLIFSQIDEKVMHKTTSFIVLNIHWLQENFHCLLIHLDDILSSEGGFKNRFSK